ncbi:50S ribosomal protein L7 [uncultured Oscillibacter sp.]|jgi:ribosomal protein L7Ae-like RNA K-turn-binding protein|uniref:50S ribosomal protein L7 n=3 Tax=uncultured Oscillibacter sp. TaxID=876091 RepID=UPI00216BC26B|nr:50S ribosomal protein L7 [uncultured Oscillibacter sp.]MCI9011925.1 50S ribosomal protein L7 [Oscillibacter sp.]
MSGNNVLSLLGLALRGGRLAVGEEPAALAAKAGQARLLLTSSDAAGNTLRRAEHLAEEGHCLHLTLPFSKAELGGALGRGSAAVAALTDTGLAAAVAERLAQADPERYGEAAARMELKRRRAKERKEAPRRDPPKREPPQGRDRRPPKRAEGRSPRDGGRPEERRTGKPRPWGGERTGRPYGGKPGEGRPRRGDHPGGPRPAGGRGERPGRPPRYGGRAGPKPPRGGGRDKGGGR